MFSSIPRIWQAVDPFSSNRRRSRHTVGSGRCAAIAAHAVIAETLETRIVLSTWQPLGPFSAADGQVENITPNDQIAGALHTVIAHPTNADVLFVGSVNGGVWRTDNATALQPSWTPLTDDLPGLSIGAMTFDVADNNFNTVYAGVGRYSSFGRIGSDRIGLVRTTDGGANWEVVDGGGTLQGKNISGMHVNGNTIVVSVNIADNFTFGNIGIFRSTDGGASFTQISDGDGSATGLPGGASYDLVADPANPDVLYTSAIFADIVGGQNGIYKSIDQGATWTKVSDATIDALLSSNTSNLEMAVGSSNNVYAAVINNGRPDGIFRSGNGGTTWTQMDTPTTNEGGTDVGLNPRGQKGPGPGATPEEIAGGQGAIHFSIVADPNDPNIVYVGGDRQPLEFQSPTSVGATDFSGRLFRGDASRPSGNQWFHLTHRNDRGPAGGGTASNSSPHADSREMTFDANGDIIEVDDGGVYRRTSPQDNTGDWFAITGNIQVTEAHDVAWDAVSDVAMTGNQDTGTTYQPFAGASLWDSLSTADGGDVVIDDVSRAALGQSVRYTSFQNLGAFRRTIWDASGNLMSTVFPARTVTSGANFVGAFRTPVELNTIDPARLIIQGSNSTYESFNQGDSMAEIGAGIGNGSILQNAIAYGGRQGGIVNPDVLWVASGSNVFFRSGPGGLAPTADDPTGATIRDLAIDPDDWASAFVIDSNQVFSTTNEGGLWTDITGDLLNFVTNLYSIVYVAGTTFDAIVVGTNLGVYASSTTAPGTWLPLGATLPNALIYDMEYDVADDVLVAGTMGRGAWLLGSVIQEINDLFGNPFGQISGTKFNDINGNGAQNSGEFGLENWTIFIDRNGNGVFDNSSAALDPDAFSAGTNLNSVNPDVSLTHVDSGNNFISSSVPAIATSFASTAPNAFGNDSFDTWNDGRRLRIDFNVFVTSVSLDVIGDDTSDFGELQIFDASDNLLGTYSSAELTTNQVETMTLSNPAGIAYAVAYGVGLQTVYFDNLVYSGIEEFQITDASGNYTFANLLPDTYRIGEVQQLGWDQTTQQGPGENGFATVMLAAGQLIMVDFGNQQVDDHSNSAIGATPLPIGSTLPGTIEVGGDVDVFSVDLVAGTDYLFFTTLNSLPDSTLTLFDTDGTTQLDFDDNSGSGLASLISFTPAVNGTYFLQVAAINGTQTGTYSITANGPSTAPLSVDLLPAFDTGISNSDDITRLNNDPDMLEFAVGGTIPGAIVNLYADGTLIGSAVAVGTTTNVTTDGTLPLSEGSRSFTARQVVPGETESADSPALTVIIDTIAPAAPVIAGFNDDTGILGDGITGDTTPTVFGTAEPNATVTLMRNLSQFIVPVDSNGDWSHTDPQTLADGGYDYSATASDAAGNVSTPSSTLSFTVDQTPPSVALTVPASTGDTTPEVTVTASDANGLPDGTTVLLDVDLNNDNDFDDLGELGYTSSSLTGGTSTFDVMPELALGMYQLRARVDDVAGNEGASTVEPMTVEGQPPIDLTFDFGRDLSATAPGATPVLANSFYSPQAGFGWVGNPTVETSIGAPSSGDALHRDNQFIRTGSGEFRVNLPNGEYDVTVIIGSVLYPFHPQQIFLNGVLVDTAATSSGQFHEETYQVTVTNGLLQVNLQANIGSTGITGLIIFGTPDGPPVNNPPSINLTNTVTFLAEDTDTSSRILVGQVEIIDDGQGTNNLQLSGPDQALFELDGLDLYLKANTVLDATNQPQLGVTVEVNDPDVGGPVDDSETLVIDVNPVPTFIQTFDFGRDLSATAAGATPVLTNSFYSQQSSFGWVGNPTVESTLGGLSQGDNLHRDNQFIRVGSGEFRVDLPNGDYRVTVIIGSVHYRFHPMRVSLNGVLVDTVSTTTSQFHEETYQVTVTDGVLRLNLESEIGASVGITGLIIEQ